MVVKPDLISNNVWVTLRGNIDIKLSKNIYSFWNQIQIIPELSTNCATSTKTMDFGIKNIHTIYLIW